MSAKGAESIGETMEYWKLIHHRDMSVTQCNLIGLQETLLNDSTEL